MHYIIMQLGEIIAQKRKELNLSQSKLASLSGIHRNTIGNIETGKQFPNQATLEKIAQALQISLPELYSCAGLDVQIAENYETDPAITRFKILLDRLPPERQLEFVELLDKLLDILAGAR